MRKKERAGKIYRICLISNARRDYKVCLFKGAKTGKTEYSVKFKLNSRRFILKFYNKSHFNIIWSPIFVYVWFLLYNYFYYN
jgi:hypothetical protein